jgi:putative acetyltransferase
MTNKHLAIIRFTEYTDEPHLKKWLEDPQASRWFPMYDDVEIDDSSKRWISFTRYRCSLTAVINDEPKGIATLFLQPYRKLAHQCEFGIIVSPDARNAGIGTLLISSLETLAKETFKIELLHLQVYEGNPAERLYARMGFTTFGYQARWIKESDGCFVGRKFMEKDL